MRLLNVIERALCISGGFYERKNICKLVNCSLYWRRKICVIQFLLRFFNMVLSSMFTYRKLSFTLIEMLIVIVIIGVLAAALVPRLTSLQGRARDTKRKADFTTILNANEIFFIDNTRYASHGWVGYLVSTASQPWIPELSGVLATIPTDPINDNAYYRYTYASVYATPVHTYDLHVSLENRNDPDRCGVKVYYSNTHFPSSHVRCSLWQTGINNGMIYDVSPNIKNSVY